MKPDKLTKAERDLLSILRQINAIEIQCQHLQAAIAVPPRAYKHLRAFREEIARWGIENIAKAGGENEKT